MSYQYPVDMYLNYLRTLQNECERAIILKGPMRPYQYADLVRAELHRSIDRMNRVSGAVKRAGSKPERPYEPAN